MDLMKTIKVVMEGTPNLIDKNPPEGKRPITSPPRGRDGLYIQPQDQGADREGAESHNRERFAGHFNFADEFIGRPNSVDKKGTYNCADCNQEHKSFCLLLKNSLNKPLRVETVGSCEDWEVKSAGDPEMVLSEKTVDSANYGVAKNGVGFGCSRCPFASKAIAVDSQGRELYCGKGDFRTFGYACCSLNGAPVK